jgi:hypothetical protein
MTYPLYIDDIDTDWQAEGLKKGSMLNVNSVFLVEEIIPRTMLPLIILRCGTL